MYGWTGNILRVNLTTGTLTEEKLDPKIARDYIGGRGLGVYYLNKEMDPRIEPFSPENMMIMAVGPLTGTKAPTGARYMIMTKSPLTGSLTCSNSGGKFPKEMKKSGFDAFIFTGRAEQPVYLWVDNGKYELRPASHLWGKTVNETTDILNRETTSDAKVACIGPAGERLVLFAAVMNDKDRAAARSGVGAVMGSKNLKAVVVRGENDIPIYDEVKFKEHRAEVLHKFKEANKDSPPVLRLYGTSYGVASNQKVGTLPTKNFQQGIWEKWEKVSAQTMVDNFLEKPKFCADCPIGCGRGTRVKDPEFEGEGEGPEYETIYAFGPDCLNDNLAAVIKANYICNDLGMDTISMGATIACAMELYDRGYLTEKDIGQPLKWGDAKAIVEFTRRTGYREGFGDILAQGSYRMADRYGHPELAMVSKKQDLAGYHPNGIQGMGLAYATSPIGASHMRAQTAYFEVFGVPTVIDPQKWEGKPRLVKIHQDMASVLDSTGVCYFFAIRYYVLPVLEVTPEGFCNFLNAATGAGYTIEEVEKAGERIFNAERQFMVKAGFSRKDDSLPDRLVKEPMPEGPAKGLVVHLDEMLDEYYKLRGWDQNGIPTIEKLNELGLA
ncbi:MAG: aldehyde ferredoxin oxidoreductase family protein [Candidatus Schekmanbacteria bacterium]|nr:aldehyde ferredoxin oxidoreductase family protein [Candidatus Schekmanbacteria bacterium]